MFKYAPSGMAWTTRVFVVGVVLLVVGAITDAENRGLFIALSVLGGSFTLGAVLLTRAASRRLQGSKE